MVGCWALHPESSRVQLGRRASYIHCPWLQGHPRRSFNQDSTARIPRLLHPTPHALVKHRNPEREAARGGSPGTFPRGIFLNPTPMRQEPPGSPPA